MRVQPLRLFRFLLMMVALPLVLGGCFHSDNNESPAAASELLSGTVATGAPVTGIVYVKDKNGSEVNVAIGNNGGYSISVTGMSAPFMVKAVPASGDTLYSYAAAANVTANITPLTMLALFLGHNQGDLAALYDTWASNSGTLTTAEIQAAQTIINANFAARIQAAGLDANSYDFLTTAFTANGTGIDAVLDGIRISVNPTAGSFAVTAADGTSVSFNLAIDASAITIGGTKGSSGACSSGWCLAVSGTVTTSGVAVNIPPVATVSGLPDSAVPTSSNGGNIWQSIQDAYGATGTVSNLAWTIVSSSATEVVAHLTFNVAVTSPVALSYAYDLTYTYTKASGAGSGGGSSSGNVTPLVSAADYAIVYAGGADTPTAYANPGIDMRPEVNAQFDTSGNLTGYTVLTNAYTQENERPTIGTASVAELASDGVMSIGRWSNGQLGGKFFTSTLAFSSNRGFHYAVTKPTLQSSLPASGTASYTLTAATKPTYRDAHAAPGTLTGNAVIDYAAKTVALELTLTFADATYTLTTTGGVATPGTSEVSHADPSNFLSGKTLGSVYGKLLLTGGACTSACAVDVVIVLGGSTGERLGVVLQSDGGISATVPGGLHAAAMFTKQP